MNLKRTFRRASCLVTRLTANMGVAGSTPILAHIRNPVESSKGEKRWLDGLYLDVLFVHAGIGDVRVSTDEQAWCAT